jgi:hypothetical protein
VKEVNMRKPIAAGPAVMLLFICLLTWVQPAQADVVYTEVLKGPKQAKATEPPVKSQIYLNHQASRREVQSPLDTAPPNEYFSSTIDGSGYPLLEILRLDKGMLWTKDASGELESYSLKSGPAMASKARLCRMKELADIEIISSQPVLRRTGLRKEVNDHMCDHIFATITCDARDRKTGDRGTLVLMNDLWVARNAPGMNEIRNYLKALGGLYGLPEYFCPDAALFAEALPEQAKQMGELVSQVQGLPVSATMTAKFKRKAGGETFRSDLLYSLTTEMLDIETVAYSPNIYELPQ